MSRDRSDEPDDRHRASRPGKAGRALAPLGRADPAIDEPAGDETVVAVPRSRRKPKFLASESKIKTAIYEPPAGERPPTIPEGTDEIALEQPDVTDTAVQTGMTLDPGQRARVREVHDKADRLLAELDATASLRIRRDPIDPEARTEPAQLDESPITEELDDFDDDDYDDDSLEEGETVVDPRRPGYPHPAPPEEGPKEAIRSQPLPAMPAHTPAPGAVVGAPIADTSRVDESDDEIAIATIETGWSLPRPSPDNPRLAPFAPRPMAAPPRRSVGSVLLAPFRAIASLFRPAPPPLPGIGETGKLETYTEVNRMVERRRQHKTSSPPPNSGGDGD